MDLTFHQKNEPDPCHVLVLRIEFSKTVSGDNPIYARGLRHKDARLCHIVALVLWLMAPFHVYNETEGIDFTDNKA